VIVTLAAKALFLWRCEAFFWFLRLMRILKHSGYLLEKYKIVFESYF